MQLTSENELLQSAQCLHNSSMEPPKNRYNGLALKGLSPSKAYLEGNLIVVALVRPRSGSKGDGIPLYLSFGYDSKAADSRHPPVFGNREEILYGDPLLSRQKNHMLVGDVEPMDSEEVVSIPSFVRLHNIDDVVDNRLAWPMSRFGMSFDGTFKALPICIFTKGETSELSDGISVGLDQGAVRVIQGGAEVVQRIPQDGGCVRGDRCSDAACRFPLLTAALGVQSIFVRIDVCHKNAFQIVDVMFGPFGL